MEGYLKIARVAAVLAYSARTVLPGRHNSPRSCAYGLVNGSRRRLVPLNAADKVHLGIVADPLSCPQGLDKLSGWSTRHPNMQSAGHARARSDTRGRRHAALSLAIGLEMN